MVAKWDKNGALGETEFRSVLRGGVHLEAGGFVRAK